MKKRLLFVNESLALAGGEKSLIALLAKLDPNLYEVDLQLFSYGRGLDSHVPDFVNLLPPIPYTEFSAQPWLKNMMSVFKKPNFSFLKAKLGYSFALQKGGFNTSQAAELYWRNISNVISPSEKEYDVAIAYAHNIPTFYVHDKINAKRKFTWINVGLNFIGENKEFQYNFYKDYDTIVPVSEVTQQQVSKLFPDLSHKLYTIYDMIDYLSMIKMANMNEVPFKKNTFNILTVARLNKMQKGYDITLEACKILKDKGLDFHWYAIGAGDYKSEMETFIKVNKLENHFTLLGTTSNPYPYFKAADLYVQTSRHEGFGLSIAESRLLNVPVVTTRFDTVFMQMKHEKNGLVVDIEAKAIANAIERLMKNQELYQSIVAYLEKEPKENLESLERFNQLVLT